MEKHSADNHILQMVEMFIKLELYVQTVFNTDFHLHLCDFLSLFHITVVMQNCEIHLFDNGSF